MAMRWRCRPRLKLNQQIDVSSAPPVVPRDPNKCTVAEAFATAFTVAHMAAISAGLRRIISV